MRVRVRLVVAGLAAVAAGGAVLPGAPIRTTEPQGPTQPIACHH